jgi:26S proteasome regulatory subunit N9
MQLDSEDPTTYLTQALTHPQLPEELKPYYEAFQRFYDGK